MITFERECRTPTSESHVIWEDGGIVGRIDLHIQGDTVHGTLCTTADASEVRIKALIEEIDERLVMTWAPMREDLVVSTWRGSPAGTFSDTNAFADDEDEEDEA